MRIEFERSGGFMGLRQTVQLDTDEMDPNEASEIRKMIESAGFFDLPEELSGSDRSVDQYHYRVTVEFSQEYRHTVVVGDSDAPEDLQPLLQRLNLLARTRR
jgi:hypothetical protein